MCLQNTNTFSNPSVCAFLNVRIQPLSIKRYIGLYQQQTTFEHLNEESSHAVRRSLLTDKTRVQHPRRQRWQVKLWRICQQFNGHPPRQAITSMLFCSHCTGQAGSTGNVPDFNSWCDTLESRPVHTVLNEVNFSKSLHANSATVSVIRSRPLPSKSFF